jgi:hypothetical protein
MGRKTKRIKGPIATDPASWPPIRRRNSEDQKTLERLLSEELDAHWKAIVREDGVAEEEHAELKARDRLRALDRAKYGDTKLLEEFVKNSIGPDGKPLGEVFAKFVRREVRPKHQKLPKDHSHEAQDSKWLQKKTEAVWEADRAKAILERVYGRTPDDYKTRTDLIVAARRSAIDQQEIRDWQKNRRCPNDPWQIWPARLPPKV